MTFAAILAAAHEVLVGAFVLVAIAGLAWLIANAFESWRYLRARRRQAPKVRGLRLVISNNNRERKRA